MSHFWIEKSALTRAMKFIIIMLLFLTLFGTQTAILDASTSNKMDVQILGQVW